MKRRDSGTASSGNDLATWDHRKVGGTNEPTRA